MSMKNYEILLFIQKVKKDLSSIEKMEKIKLSTAHDNLIFQLKLFENYNYLISSSKIDLVLW